MLPDGYTASRLDIDRTTIPIQDVFESYAARYGMAAAEEFLASLLAPLSPKVDIPVCRECVRATDGGEPDPFHSFKVGRSRHIDIPTFAPGCMMRPVGLLGSRRESVARVPGKRCDDQARCYNCGSLVLWPKLKAAHGLLTREDAVHVSITPISKDDRENADIIRTRRNRLSQQASRLKKQGVSVGRLTLVNSVPGHRDQPTKLTSISTHPLSDEDRPILGVAAWELLKDLAVVGEVAANGFRFGGAWEGTVEKKEAEWNWLADLEKAPSIIRFAREWFGKYHPEWRIEVVLGEKALRVGDGVFGYWKGTSEKVCEHRWEPAWATMMDGYGIAEYEAFRRWEVV